MGLETSSFAEKWAGNHGRRHTRLDTRAVLDAYIAEYIETQRPAPLSGKDARNPFLMRHWEAENAEVDAKRDAMITWLEANPSAVWHYG
jgi:hypothetical protein